MKKFGNVNLEDSHDGIIVTKVSKNGHEFNIWNSCLQVGCDNFSDYEMWLAGQLINQYLAENDKYFISPRQLAYFNEIYRVMDKRKIVYATVDPLCERIEKRIEMGIVDSLVGKLEIMEGNNYRKEDDKGRSRNGK